MSLSHPPNVPAATSFGNAAAYDALMGRWSERLADPFLDFCRLPLAGHFLDVGCGTGSLISALRRRTPAVQLTGVDTDLGFVAHAQARFAASPVRIQPDDACALSQVDEHFDATLALLLLMALDDPEAAASEMRRVTRSGGLVAACTWKHESLAMSQVVWEEAVQLDPAAETAMGRFKRCNRPGQLSTLWHHIGLHDVDETEIEIHMDFVDFDDFWLPLQRGVGPGGAYLRDMEASAKAALRRALRARLLDCGSDRPFSLPASALAVRGRVAD